MVLNVVDFQNRQFTTTEAEFMENKAAREEFKFKDDSDDEDLLGQESELAKMRAALKKSKSNTIAKFCHRFASREYVAAYLVIEQE